MKRLLLISALILPLSGCLINKAHAQNIILTKDFDQKMIHTLAKNEGYCDTPVPEPKPGQIVIRWECKNNSVVQTVEQQSPKLRVGGSIPSTVAK